MVKFIFKHKLGFTIAIIWIVFEKQRVHFFSTTPTPWVFGLFILACHVIATLLLLGIFELAKDISDKVKK